MDLTNFDIDKVLSKHRPKLFYKVLAYDEFNPKKCPYLPIAIVVNTFPLRKKDGGHWVALYIDSRKQAIFFDSYGLEPFGKFRLFFKNHAAATVYNASFLQLNNFSCGYHVIFFIMQIKKKKSLQKVLDLYRPHLDRDKMVVRFFNLINA